MTAESKGPGIMWCSIQHATEYEVPRYQLSAQNESGSVNIDDHVTNYIKSGHMVTIW